MAQAVRRRPLTAQA